MITFAICDDEPLMARELAGHLADYMKENSITDYSVTSFFNGRTLLERAGGFDVIFLDIQMEQPDGMETARLLRQRGDRGLLVFVTVLKEYVFDSFQVEAFDYLLKPFDRVRFRQTMDRLLRSLEHRTVKDIVIQRGTGCEVIRLSDIVYCEVLGRKVYLHKNGGAVIDYYDKLENLERRVIRLPSPGEMFLNNRLEITVLKLSGAGLVRLIQTFLPQRTAAAVFLFRPVFPEQPAATSIQPLAPQFFPVRAQVYVPLFIIGECIPLQFSFRAVMGGLWHDKEVDAQFFQRSVCQGKVIGGVRRSGLQRHNMFMDVLQLLQIGP